MIEISEKLTKKAFMSRCIQLASKGRGVVSPNPMVGAVLVCNGVIVGEGYHRQYGSAHAEVNAIQSVADKSLLPYATLYVSLEPCSHHGKTPPCSQLVIDSKIPRVVVGCLDPFPEVSGRGVKMLREAGVEVEVGMLEAECKYLNRDFIKAHQQNLPYIYLKWAQTSDGFMDRVRTLDSTEKAVKISNSFTQLLVHKLRSEVDAIMVGTNTALLDNPTLSTRYWYGKNPIRVAIDKKGRIGSNSNLLDGSILTYIISEDVEGKDSCNVKYIKIDTSIESLIATFGQLKNEGIKSVMVEGGSKLLQYLIDHHIWDEAFVEVANASLSEGIKAPVITGNLLEVEEWFGSKRIHFLASN